MNFVKLIESSYVEDIADGDLVDIIIKDHYHKARIAQRAISNLDQDIKDSVLGSWSSYIKNNTLVIDIDLVDKRCGEDIVNALNSYQEENFNLEAVIYDGMGIIKLTISQTFDGREDDVRYGD